MLGEFEAALGACRRALELEPASAAVRAEYAAAKKEMRRLAKVPHSLKRSRRVNREQARVVSLSLSLSLSQKKKKKKKRPALRGRIWRGKGEV